MITDSRAPADVIQRGAYLYGVTELRHVAPHQLPGAQLPGDGECLIERPGIRTCASVEIVYPKIVHESYVFPAAECLDEQRLAPIARDQLRSGTRTMRERNNHIQRGVEWASTEFRQHDGPACSQSDRRHDGSRTPAKSVPLLAARR